MYCTYFFRLFIIYLDVQSYLLLAWKDKGTAKIKDVLGSRLHIKPRWVFIIHIIRTWKSIQNEDGNTYMEIHTKHGVWKSQKKSHSTLRAKQAMITFWMDKSKLKMPKIVHFDEFLKTVLPDRSVLIGQKLVENAKIQKFKCDILSNFETFWGIFRVH